MWRILKKRVAAGVMAAMLMLVNVVMPVQPVFADGPGNGGGRPTGDVTTQEDEAKKVFVCKYVSTPEEREIASHIISVSVANKEYKPGDLFVDAQGTSFVLAFDNGQPKPSIDECPTFLAPPVMPGYADPCNPISDPTTSNVYWSNYSDTDAYYWVVNNDGSITAFAKDGFLFKTSDTEYVTFVTYQLPEDSGVVCVEEQVTIPVALEVADPCGLDNATLITTPLDSIKNITYKVLDNGDVMVTAEEGYVVTIDGKTTYKNYTYDAAEDSGDLCEATSETPKFVDLCGTTNDYYIVKDTENVAYYNGEELLVAGKKYYVTDASEVTITAKATDDDYEIVNQTEYVKQFTDKACVELDAKAWCDNVVDTKIKATVTNTTKMRQAYQVVVTDSEDNELYTKVVLLKKGATEKVYVSVDGDGEFTVSVYNFTKKDGRGTLLEQATVMTECVDTFTPEIYKKNQDGAILSTGTFDVEVCQEYGEFALRFMDDEGDNCTTYEDVMFGTDGSWFANNVEYEHNVPTTVTITETEAPVGCELSITPWVFTWNYLNMDVNAFNAFLAQREGSWEMTSGVGSVDGQVFNLTNNCDQPGRGEYTPTPSTPVETLAETGDSENAIIGVAAGMLLASIGLAISPRFRRGEA